MSINVLCLHGCSQTQAFFQQLLKTYIRLGKQYDLTFHFMEAKYDHFDGGKTWYHIPLYVEEIGSKQYSESLVADCLDDVEQQIKQNNIQVLLGFSQGANVVDTYLSHRNHLTVKCAVLFSGYALVDPERQPVDIPVLTVASEEDDIVPYKFTPAAPVEYSNVQHMTHDKGHKLPTKNSQIREICQFMQNNAK